MNFTKQDIQKLITLLGRHGVKDSQFKKADVLSEDARVPVIDDGINQTASARLMSKWVAKNIDLSDVFVNIEGRESTNLESLLAELSVAAGAFVTPDGQYLIAEMLKCNKKFRGVQYTDFGLLLEQFISAFDELYSKFDAIKYADYDDITEIITTISTNS